MRFFVPFALWAMIAALSFAADSPYDRREVARETYRFLYDHALCFYPEEPKPCQWYDDAYELHWAAKQLDSTKPLGKIRMPDSDFDRGAYEWDTLVWLQHESLLFRIANILGSAHATKP